MAFFGDVVTIRSLIDPSTEVFPCLTPYNQDKIILSESKHLAVIYDLKTCLPVKCWTFSESDPLAAPFIYDTINDRFIALKKFKLALFKCDSEDDCVQVKLNNQVHCLLTSSKYESLVLFKNGLVRKLSLVIEERGRFSGKEIIPESENIKKVVIIQHQDDQVWILMFTNSKDGTCLLYLINVNLNEGTGVLENKFNLRINYKSLTVNKNGQPIGLSEKGDIYSLHQDSEQLLMSIKNSSIIGSLCLPEDDTLAVVVKENQNYQLQIINLKYLVKTSHLNLDLTPLPDFICRIDGNLFIGGSKGLLSIPYEIKPASLASVLGKSMDEEKTASSDHLFLDSSTDIKINISKKDDFNLDELEKQLPKDDELLSEKAIFSALATIMQSKRFTRQDEQYSKLLTSILSRPFNHDFMVAVMKEANLNIEQFVQITDILTEMMDVGRDYIVDWLNVVLDAHFKLILFSKSDIVKNALLKVTTTLGEMQNSLEQVRELTILIENLLTSERGILNNNHLFNNPRNDKYCIEVLEL